ncbi:MAG: type VI secretion system contractile sheath domain-containing protein, partial [Burkholderiales bacterium]
MAETQVQNPQAEALTLGGNELANLLQKEFKPKSEEAKGAVEQAVRTLAEQALSQTKLIGSDVVKSIEAIIAELDRKLSEQVNLIMHHADFQQLEGGWRGLHYLVNNTETDEMLKIRVMNISKKDLHKTLRKFKGAAWDQSPIFKRLYEEEFGQLGGEPYGCLVGDYYFDQTPPDAELLGEMSKVAAAAHTPFIAGASPTVMQMETWQELANPRDLTKIFTTPEYAG